MTEINTRPIYKFQLMDIGEYDVHIAIEPYQKGGRPAIMLIEADTGEDFLVATINLPCCGIESDEVVIKDYEIPGVLEFLQQHGIVGPEIRKVPTGMVQVPVVKLLKKPEDFNG